VQQERCARYAILVVDTGQLHLLLALAALNPLTPNGHYSGRTAPPTSRRSILNIYSTNIRTEYFKHTA
jgi:hypothetical protein